MAGNSSLTECNATEFLQPPSEQCLPSYMKLSRAAINTIVIYFVLFVLSAVCNLSMLGYICVMKLRQRSRLHMFMFHLSIADLIITFITIPMEIGWKYTVYWKAGAFACHLFQFLRPIGIYLASFIIISLSIDRYFAILYPLKLYRRYLRAENLVYVAYTVSIICSVPQAFVFSLEAHPVHKWYTQCVDFKFRLLQKSDVQSARFYEIMFLLYQIFVASITFFLPFAVIVITYSRIFLHMVKNMRKSNQNSEHFSQTRNETIRRAKKKTLRLAIVIVLVFLVCWTPYYSISILFWIDQKGASETINERVYNFLFIFAVSSCLGNPLVYGLTALKTKEAQCESRAVELRKSSQYRSIRLHS
nr:G protein-coupled receptor [Proales similis]